ncbi:MAG TPA: DHH family phosphoesterase, partial [Bacilli bacterium]|nr:DHH family phosphoesterase [Bacilli bacterium]
MEKIYIFGHKNPDTDSVCGSISLSYLKNKLGIKSEPRILGSINPETEYALKKFKTDVPEYLNDVKVQIKDVDYNKSYMINQNEAIIDAFNLMHEEG